MFLSVCMCVFMSVCLSVYTSIYLHTQKAVLKLQSLIAAVKVRVVKLTHTAFKISHIFRCENKNFHQVPPVGIIRSDVSSEPYVLRSPTEYHSQLKHCRQITT